LTELSTERAVQIAAEGRKYGLHLLCSTQQPHKVHPNAVSQCDNLVLMRMNSKADIADLARTFSFVPEGLMSRASTFGLGEALVAGRLLPEPGFVRMGQRITQQGGSDVSTAWALPRPAS
jgi:DNA helicase HerA-like ATPase